MKSLRIRLMVTMLALGLVPLVLGLFVTGTYTEATLLSSNRKQMHNIGSEIKRQVQQNIDQIMDELRLIAFNPAFRRTPPVGVVPADEFRRLSQNSRFGNSLFIMSERGDVEMEANPNDFNAWDRQAQKVMETGEPSVSQAQFDNLISPPSVFLDFLYPIKDEDGVTFRVVKAKVYLTSISYILREATFGDNFKFVLLDGIGNVLYHDKTDFIFSKFPGLSGLPMERLEKEEEMTLDKKLLMIDTQSIPTSKIYAAKNWKLITTMDKDLAMELVRKNRWTAFGVAGMFLLGTGIVGYYMARNISRPITAASEAARAVAGGNMKMRLDYHGADELKELSAAFNQMSYEVLQHQEKLELLVDSRTRKLQLSQHSLSETTAQLHAANEASKEGLFVINQAGEVITANGRMEEIFGMKMDHLRNRPLDDIRQEFSIRFRDADEFNASWDEAMSSQRISSETEWAIITPQQKTLSIFTAPVLDEEDTMIARLWMFRDITNQRLLEDSLRQSQKMEAVGRLAGGVAHDFNNLLQGILGNLFIVQQDNHIMHNDELRRSVQSARSAGLRAAELIKGLLGFSRQTHLSLSLCSVNDVLQTTHALIKPTFDPRICINVDVQDGIWGINADSNQIEQVIMNMIVNAKDAMPNGGNLILTTRNIVIPPDQIDNIPGSAPGEFVRISITDEGTGMSDEVRSKIFEPFFTTKEQGKGTGLGLATSFGIVQQHGGWIHCDSAVGHGTTFHIFLPRNEVQVTPATPLPPATRPIGGQETILIVDDEMVVRAVAEAILKKHGYKIVTACDGEEALDKLARHDGEIDLVLMDMTMPRLSGMDTFRHMRKGQAPNVPVVICSGYLVDLSGFAEETGCIPNGFLQKPYEIDDMSRTVRRVLDETATTKVRS